MHSITLILSALTALTTATRPYANVWHIQSLEAVCQDRLTRKECSYIFNIVGEKSPDLPGFTAQCSARSLPDDKNLRPCRISGHGGQGRVQEVNSFLAFYPEKDGVTELNVELVFGDETGATRYWTAKELGSYEFFAQTPADFDIVPSYEKGVTK